MLGAALFELTMANFRAALGLGTAAADCNIRAPEKHAAGLLCALRTGQVTSHAILPVAVQNLHFCMDDASGNTCIWTMVLPCVQSSLNISVWASGVERVKVCTCISANTCFAH